MRMMVVMASGIWSKVHVLWHILPEGDVKAHLHYTKNSLESM